MVISETSIWKVDFHFVVDQDAFMCVSCLCISAWAQTRVIEEILDFCSTCGPRGIWDVDVGLLSIQRFCKALILFDTWIISVKGMFFNFVPSDGTKYLWKILGPLPADSSRSMPKMALILAHSSQKWTATQKFYLIVFIK